MRPCLALASPLLVALVSGCWLEHQPPGGGPVGDGDADADADADTDVDADVDADADGDSDPPPPDAAVRPEQVCDMRGFSNVTGGTLRVMTLDCVWIDGCTAVASGDTVDLRPTSSALGRYPGEPGARDCAGITWADCLLPPGEYSRLTVWGEDLAVPCFGGDMDDCEAPDCVQLPFERLPDGCEIETIVAEQVCGPSEVQTFAANDYSVVNECGCAADWRPAGCAVSQSASGPRFEARVARCSECGPEDVCVTRSTTCSLYDPPADLGSVSLQFVTWSEPIAFDVAVGGWGEVVCQP